MRLFMRIFTNRFVFSAIVVFASLRSYAQAVDYADSAQRGAWLRHPVYGDASFDGFEHEKGNPICRGAAPYEWPVNGFLFADPMSGNWYAYVGEYCEGYALKPDAPSRCVVYCSTNQGKSWKRLGPAFAEGKHFFTGEVSPLSHAPDVSVVYVDGKYHMAFDWTTENTTWANAANPPPDANSGVGYAWADRPEGPYHPIERPIATTRDEPMLLGKYRRLYASTLLKRKHDWLVLTLTDSGPYFGWALLAMSADKPEGPYTKPAMLLNPDVDRFYPPLLEFFPAFVYEGYIYAPATSVASNRNYQAVFRVPIEDALKPEAWILFQHGSVWHAEPVENEYYGIWGQTFSGFVGGDDVFHVMYPSRDAKGFGTINLAERRWDTPYRAKGFSLSGHSAPSLVVLKRGGPIKSVDAELTVNGAATLIWDYQGPLGPDRPASDSKLHALSLTRYSGLELTQKKWSLVKVDAQGTRDGSATGEFGEMQSTKASLVWGDSGIATLSISGQKAWSGALERGLGPIALLVQEHSNVFVSRFAIDGGSNSAHVSYLYTEALLDAAQNLSDWDVREDAQFRFGIGAVSHNAGARVKWNVEGTAFALWAPRGPEYGEVEVFADGKSIAKVNCYADSPKRSQNVVSYTWKRGTLHAARLESVSGKMPVDSMEVSL